jgi:hypothetical protein
MVTKAEKMRRKRENRDKPKAKAHPMSAGAREPNGRPATSRAYREPQACAPTPELLAHLANNGPTDIIQRAAKREIITQEGAQALETFASIRRLIGVAEYRPSGVLASMMPAAITALTPDERRAWAMTAYREACALVLGNTRGSDALDAVTDACDNRAPRSWPALAQGAAVLARRFVAGKG